MKLISLLRVAVVPFSLVAAGCSDSSEPGSPTGGTAGSSASSSSSTGSNTAATGTPASTSSTSASTSSTTGSGGGGAGGSDTTASTTSTTSTGMGGAGGAGGTGTTGSAGSAGSGSGSGGTSGAGGSGATDGGATEGGKGGSGGAAPVVDGGASAMMNFFVSSDTSMTGNLGGLMGADMRCQRLATAVGAGGKTWRAYLSAMTPATNARDRIGDGPYYNSAGALVAMTKDALHMRAGDANLFITERGAKINGQWAMSPTPNQHDILTGATREGMIFMNNTCGDWMSTMGSSGVGHADGLGPNMGTTGALSYWNAAHTGQCGNTAPGGGAGRIYCFVGP